MPRGKRSGIERAKTLIVHPVDRLFGEEAPFKERIARTTKKFVITKGGAHYRRSMVRKRKDGRYHFIRRI